jgi:hypothetical protein
MNQKYGPRDTNHDLRPRKLRDYSHMYATLEGIAMTQHTINPGLKMFSEAGTNAVLQELKQLHDRKVVEPKTFHDLPWKERRDSLRYPMFLKEKRYSLIKGRSCADRRKQRDYLTKEETSPPPPSLSNQ